MREIGRSIAEPSLNPADGFLERLQYVAMWLEEHAQRTVPGLTDPDTKTGEQWEWGQVWAHLGEFVPYWVHQAGVVLRWPGAEPVPFGRIKTDEARVAAIERDRRLSPNRLMERLKGHLADLWEFVDQIPSDGWSRTGVHQTLGVMDMRQIVDEFLVGHLEEHEAQLRQLVGRERKSKNGE
ncbi:MAG TPA: hypothetical protein VHH54_03750 [Actinomycetota bacterium]|nr:hypothetical protein [Actinomycetota bacterium]